MPARVGPAWAAPPRKSSQGRSEPGSHRRRSGPALLGVRGSRTLHAGRALRMVVCPMTIRTSVLALPLLLAAACASRGPSIDRVWAELEADARHTQPLADPDARGEAATADRAAEARRIAEAGELESGRDHFRAALVLAESKAPADWALAAELGRKAAELGEPLGLRVAAEAIDKDLVRQGLPQRFGTQFAWDAAREIWRLHPIDPATTDAERASMGVPTYSELIAAELALNARAAGQH